MDTISGTELREMRKAAGLTQRALAEKLGVATVTVKFWEQGRNGIRPIIAGVIRQWWEGRKT